ncbi:MAG: PIN domain-containing protein [Desulfurococcaceae archaeon]|nr:PIN domain-containing protein [Desulfurococcaceae archaeon]
MEKKREMRTVIVDTYAVLAMAYGELGEEAEKVLLSIRRGDVVGYLPVTVVYELCIHVLRGRIPVFESIEEFKTFITKYFRIAELRLEDYIEAARIKIEGDAMLKESIEFRNRSLSFTDSTVIWLAIKMKIPIVTGDKDLAYVAKRKGVEVIW